MFTAWCAICLLHCGQEVKLGCEVFFFWESWGSTALSWPVDHQDRLALQHLCLGLGVFKLFFNNQPPPQQKTSYCLAIWASQTKSDSIANLLNSSRKALPAKGAPHSSRSLRQHSLEPSPCVHLLVCQMSSALWTSGQAGL